MKMRSGKILTLTLALIMILSCAFSLTSCAAKPQAVRVVPGANGLTPYIGPNGTWCIGDTDTGVLAIAHNGQDGKDGKDGEDGEPGAPGSNGKDGRWVSSFEINDNGEIIVNYSDGATQNLGKFVPEDGKDAISPIIRIENGTWQYSYDNGTTWTDTGVRAEAADGTNGTDGIGIKKIEIIDNSLVVTLTDNSVHNLGNVKGKDGIDGTNGVDGTDAPVPTFRINGETKNWEISYNGQTWQDLGYSAQGDNGETPLIKIENGTWWYYYKENGWTDTGVKAEGSDGDNGQDGRGIEKMEIIDGYLYVTYTDSATPINVGKVSETVSGGDVVNPTDSTALALYPLGDGGEYGVSVGNAKYMSNVVIPSTYNGKPVTTILESAFANNNYIETIVIPYGVEEIEYNAFANCVLLESVVIPASVTRIGENAFAEISTVYLSITEEEAIARGWVEDYFGCSAIVYNG